MIHVDLLHFSDIRSGFFSNGLALSLADVPCTAVCILQRESESLALIPARQPRLILETLLFCCYEDSVHMQTQRSWGPTAAVARLRMVIESLGPAHRAHAGHPGLGTLSARQLRQLQTR